MTLVWKLIFWIKNQAFIHARWGGRNADFNKAIKRVYRELNKKDKIGKIKK